MYHYCYIFKSISLPTTFRAVESLVKMKNYSFKNLLINFLSLSLSLSGSDFLHGTHASYSTIWGREEAAMRIIFCWMFRLIRTRQVPCLRCILWRCFLPDESERRARLCTWQDVINHSLYLRKKSPSRRSMRANWNNVGPMLLLIRRTALTSGYNN